MPANAKYLTQSKWQKFAKITAGFIGGFLVTMSFHIFLCVGLNRAAVIMTSSFSSFLLWSILMIVAFLAKNGWKIWGIYLLITLFFAVVFYLNQ